jgi:hypothetical protein
MKLELPPIAEAECTPLVGRLLEIIQQQHELIQHLQDEVARLQAQTRRPTVAPSALEKPDRPTTAAAPRPGSAKRPKTAQLTIDREVVLPAAAVPDGSRFKGYQDFVVQELLLRVETTRYRRECWQTPAGAFLVADLPAEVLPGCHFGPTLVAFVLHQYHHQHVTQPLLREQLTQLGAGISAGQLSRLLTEPAAAFHQEKEDILPVGLRRSAYVGVDDTAARHQGHNGYATLIGNDLFAYFASTPRKSRVNFLELLRRPSTDYQLTEEAQAYWQEQGLPAAVQAALRGGPGHFADVAAWEARLAQLGVTAARHVRIATEGALLGSVLAHGVSPDLVVLSDGADQFNVLVHALCWVHQERPLARLVPVSEAHRQAIAGVRQRLWELYQDLKAYAAQPAPSQAAALAARFDALCAGRTGFASVDGVLQEMVRRKAELLRVLQRPEVPLHNNGSENAIRDYVTKRKVSGGTRSAAGRRCRDTFASLKKTCRKLGVNFWAYLQDRVRGRGQIARLAELIGHRAAGVTGGGLAAAPV